MKSHLQKYQRRCPSCTKIVISNHSSHWHYAIKHNQLCKICSAKQIANKRYKLELESWIPIFGNPPTLRKTFSRWKRIWKTLSQTEQMLVLSKTIDQKICFWNNINKYQKRKYKKTLKAAFIKYKGENHWIHRPEVYSKIIESCKKYRGDNHWFRNPNYVKKDEIS